MAYPNAHPTMSTRMILPTLLSFALVAACKTKQDSAQDNAAPPAKGGSESTAPLVLGGEAAADSLFLSLERTPCFGTCKAYRLHIYRSGYATYEGRAHVEREGMHEARIGRDTLDAILKEAERIGFYGLEDVYDSPVTDLPSLIIRMVSNGRDKEVKGRVGVPPKFRTFAETIEELMLPVAWKPIRPQE